jgi:hypothetical protein
MEQGWAVVIQLILIRHVIGSCSISVLKKTKTFLFYFVNV